MMVKVPSRLAVIMRLEAWNVGGDEGKFLEPDLQLVEKLGHRRAGYLRLCRHGVDGADEAGEEGSRDDDEPAGHGFHPQRAAPFSLCASAAATSESDMAATVCSESRSGRLTSQKEPRVVVQAARKSSAQSMDIRSMASAFML